MPSLYKLKPRFQAALRPFVPWFHWLGFTPTAVTVTAALLSVLVGTLVVTTRSPWLLLGYPVVLLVRMALNAIDGILAREFRRPTVLGALVNEIGDLISDAALYLPLALLFPAPPWLVVAIVVIALIGEAAGIATCAVGASRRYDGPFGKSDRALAFALLAVLVAADLLTGGWLAADRWLPAVLGVLLALGTLTVINRTSAGVAELRRA